MNQPPSPPGTPQRFPAFHSSRDFLPAFRKAVAPHRNEWQSLRHRVLPALLLDTEDETFAGELLGKFAHILGPQVDLVVWTRLPAAAPGPAPDGTPHGFLTLCAGAGLDSGSPTRVGTLQLRTFRLMKDLVERVLTQPPQQGLDQLDGDALEEKPLRDHVYALRDRRGLLGALTKLSCAETAPVGGWFDKVWLVVGAPLFHTLPRWCWAGWWSWRLVRSRRSWLVRWRGFDASGRFFRRMSDLLTLQDGSRSQHLETLEELLFRALLADLARARPGRFGAWARRRRSRRVVLFSLPPRGTPEAEPTRRFLDTYARVGAEAGSASLLLVGAGHAEDYARQPWTRCRDLNEAADRLGAGQESTAPPYPLVVAARRPVPVSGHEPAQGERLHPAPVKNFRWGPWTETSGLLGVGAVILVLLCRLLCGGPGTPSTEACLDGSPVEGRAADVSPSEAGMAPQDQYDEARRAIAELNAEALAAERKFGKPVRRVVYLGGGVDPDPDEVVMNGMIPELRGIFLAQQELNRLAAEDPDRIRLYVEVRDTGRNFKKVVRHAREVVREADDNARRQDSRTVIGVIGFRESREQTLEAASILNAGRVPVIGTTATADAMQEAGDYYRPMSPDNSRETAVAAQFARFGAIVETRPGHCRTAENALVIEDPDDLYTSELAEKFVHSFGGNTRTKEFPGARGREVSAQDIARTVCDVVRKDRRTVVYWASRIDSFTRFVNAYGPDSGCAGLPLTVIGSNELTNAALGGAFQEMAWLRLYHTVHVLPDGHPDENYQARQFVKNYVSRYTERDPWINDGHVALAHDALKVLSSAADKEYTSVHAVNATGVKSKLDEGIRFEGVSGEIRIPQRNGPNPPLDKALTILHYTGQGPEREQRLVLHCGAFAQNQGPVTHWGPDGRYDCPQDPR